MLRIGTAGWTITPGGRERVPDSGTHLERYSRAFPCVEINSSFHRSHRVSTWAKWAAATPDDFRFSAKLPKAITHLAKLVIAPDAFDAFVEETSALGHKLGVVLVQLPPSLAFEDCPAAEFFEAIRDRIAAPIALEPRHRSWWAPDADELLVRHNIARVAADPIRDPRSKPGALPTPGGSDALRYFRLHGSPRMYYSAYTPEYLRSLATILHADQAASDTWVIFDNTASGEALANALDLRLLTAADISHSPQAKGNGTDAKQVRRVRG